MHSTNIDKGLIAPCGMNCGICRAYLREKNKCPGCGSPNEMIFKYCVVCRIRNCEVLSVNQSSYCFDCEKYPCSKLKQLDKRYRTKYGMSMVENLNKIKEIGIDKFMIDENQRWVCHKCGDVICVHNKKCYKCGFQR
ncbi:DUF3795 domain-containing protein [Pelotomaculum propionicicum]|uniref:DUF3795 domain-containing protein n=1 Tax=Pelotomaculum propionicicum TaxID=258475 RepID=UPI003B819E40